MAQYPVKLLKDTNSNPFFPFVTTDAVLKNNSSLNLQQILDDMYTKAQVDQKITNLGTVLSFRGVVDTTSQLPSSGMTAGWVYVVRNYPQAQGGTTHAVIWDGTKWEDLGESINLDLYYSKTEVDSNIATAVSISNATERTTTNTAIATSLTTAKNYTDQVEVKLNTHKDKDLTDEVHGMRINENNKFEYWDGTEWVEVSGGGGSSGVLPLPITNFQATIVDASVKLTYSIPDDINFVGLLIRGKTGGVPVDINDGAIILNANTDAGVPIPTEVTDTNIVPGERKYYRAFPYNFVREYLMDTGQQTSAIIKLTQTAPVAPTLANRTATSIVLTNVAGNEYRMNTGEWQTSNAFLGLDPVTEYTFYARRKETDIALASPASTGVAFTTDKPAQEAPAAPELAETTSTSVVLVAVEGNEYRRGSGAWQESTGFGSLNPGTSYTFYARRKETETMGVSPSSPGATFATSKLTQEAPVAPELSSRTDTSIVLKLVTGNEYKIDGGDWQTSNAFLGLDPVTSYMFYARKRETTTYYASESSPGVSFTTTKPIPATPNTPSIQSGTETSITLVPQVGCEYRRDNEAWQSSNVFTDLTPGTSYTFYARVAETETHEASASSFGISTTTAKFTQAAPPAPEIVEVASALATIEGVEGSEVSMNGALFFDSPRTFGGLDPVTNYDAYARMKETATHYASPVSPRTKFTTTEYVPVYGIKIDEENPDPEARMTYVDDAEGFTPMDLNGGNFLEGSWGNFLQEFAIKPCLFESGNVVDYLDPDDFSKNLSGEDVDITGTNNLQNVMIEFGKPIWYDITEEDGYAYIRISAAKFSETAVKHAFDLVEGYRVFHFMAAQLSLILWMILFKKAPTESNFGYTDVDRSGDVLTSVTGLSDQNGMFHYGTEETGPFKFLGMELIFNKFRPNILEGIYRSHVSGNTYNIGISDLPAAPSLINVIIPNSGRAIKNAHKSNLLFPAAKTFADDYITYYNMSYSITTFSGQRWANMSLSSSGILGFNFDDNTNYTNTSAPAPARMMCVRNGKMYVAAYMNTNVLTSYMSSHSGKTLVGKSGYTNRRDFRNAAARHTLT